MKQLLRYYGGQMFRLKQLLRMMPPHKTYVEVFGGAAHFLIMKPPSEIEVYNDIDRYLVDFFRCLQDGEKYRKLLWRLKWTVYSREEFNLARQILYNRTAKDDVEAAWAFFVFVRQSFSGGLIAGWSFDKKEPRALPADFYDITWYEKEFQYVRNRFRNVFVECADWKDIVKRYDTQETFFFLDPPWPPSTIKNKNYLNMMSEEEHMELADRLPKIQGKFLLITYPTEYYDKMPVNRFDIETALHTQVKERKKRVITRVYYNYELPNSILEAG
jgi:DNA adenine methylase